MQTSISILPGDSRVAYEAEYLSHKGGIVINSYSELPDHGYVVCGVPFTKDGKTLNTTLQPSLSIESFLGMLNTNHLLIGGNLPGSVVDHCTRHGIKYFDVLTSEDLVQKNARLTAEGLLISLLSHTSYSIRSFRTLLIGYGHCGKEIADILSLFTDEIYVCDFDPAAKKAAASKHFMLVSPQNIHDKTHPVRNVNTIINTVPGNPFDDSVWKELRSDCIVFHIASSALSIPFPLSDSLINCPGIPGKYAPKTAGILIAKEICKHFKL